MAYNPNNANGQATMANSAPVVIASNQTDIPVASSPAAVIQVPTANSLAALNATVQYQTEDGAGIFLTLTNGPGATTAWVGTITFQYSLDGSTWNSLSVMPVAAPANSASTSTATANGLFFASMPAGTATVNTSGISYVRANMTAYTSGTVYFHVQSAAVPNARILLPWIYSVTSGQTLTGPIEATGLSEVDVQISAITTTVLTAQGTNDPTLVTWQTIPVIQSQAQVASALSMAAVATYRMNPNGYKWFRIQVTTTGTVLTVQGISATLGQQVVLTSAGNDIGVTVNSGTLTTVSTVTTCSTVTSLSQIAASVPQMNASNGSTNKQLGVSLGTATSNTDYSAQAWAAASGNGATVAPAIGDGLSCSFAVNTTAFTAGSSTGLYVYLQESPDNGTTWMDIWGCEAQNGTGFIRIPCVPIGGRRRMRWVNRAGAATTATVTATAMAIPGWAPYQRQFFDWGTTGTAANSILITGGAQTTSTSTITSALTTTTQTTAAYPIDGCTQITVKALVSGGTATTAPVVTLQYSDDFTNWVSGTTLTLPTSAGMTMTTVNNINAKYIRLNLTTAQSGGTAVALTYFSIFGQAI